LRLFDASVNIKNREIRIHSGRKQLN